MVTGGGVFHGVFPDLGISIGAVVKYSSALDLLFCLLSEIKYDKKTFVSRGVCMCV